MADEKRSLRSIQLGFASGALADDDVRLEGVRGHEELSQLYRYDLLLVRPAGIFPDDTLDKLLEERCAIALGPEPGDIIHGLLASLELLDADRDRGARYLAHLVPNVSLLTMGTSSAVYQETTIFKMVQEILESYGLTDKQHFEIRVSDAAKSPARDYVVQYQESDWDFIQRWLEYEGFYYWFEHGKEGEKLIIADDEELSLDEQNKPPIIPHADRNTLSTGKPTLWDWRHRTQRTVRHVSLLEYNHRKPNDVLVGRAEVDVRGFGTTIRYGEHFESEKLGDAVAQIRAERLRTERVTYLFRSDCSTFRAGSAFELRDHSVACDAKSQQSDDGLYLITALDVRVGYEPTERSDASAPFEATVQAIPFGTPFRPARNTPWPRIYGIMHAHIDADGSGDYAQIDASARYKVRLPFDLGKRKGLKASRWIRCAEPYTGPGYGMHMPLHKGTEVLLSFIDGDPDRPIIVGSVPNARSMGPVVDENATQAVIETASGVRLEAEDLQR